jgi:hypothetical protein
MAASAAADSARMVTVTAAMEVTAVAASVPLRDNR